MGLSALQPMVVDFIETLAAAYQSVVVLGLQKPTGEIQVGPRTTLLLDEGDRLIVLGDEAELESIRPAAGQPKREAVS